VAVADEEALSVEEAATDAIEESAVEEAAVTEELVAEEAEVVEGDLAFGAMSLGPGRAFSVGEVEPDIEGVPVRRSFEILDGRRCLIEILDWNVVAPLFEQLEEAEQAKARPVEKRLERRAGLGPARIPGRPPTAIGRQARAGAPHFEGGELVLPAEPRRWARASGGKAWPGDKPGVVADYTLLTSVSAQVLEPCVTYLVLTPVTITTLTIHNAVVKYTNNASITINGTVTCKTSPARPAVFTSVMDGTVGEAIVNPTNTPSGYYANPALYIQTYGTTLENLRIAWAQTGIRYSGQAVSPNTHTLRHVQMVNCQYGVNAFGYSIYYQTGFSAGNVLMYNVGTAVSGYLYSSTIEHLTANKVNLLASGQAGYPPAPLSVKNSVLASVTNLYSGPVTLSGSYNGFYNTTTFGSSAFTSASSPFVTNGAAAHYLANCGFRNVGTSSIDSTLASAIKKKTTYPPIELTSGFSADTVLAPQAQRDTDVYDLGWHYEPLDWVVSKLAVTGCTLLLTNGVSVGVYSDYGIELQSGARLVSEGTPSSLNRLARHNTVQEQANTNWTGGSGLVLFKEAASAAVLPEARFRFTEFPLLSAGGDHFSGGSLLGVLALTDCQLVGGRLVFTNSASGRVLALTNNLFEWVTNQVGLGTEGFTAYARNNLFKNGAVDLKPSSGNGWEWRDNVFDYVKVTQNGNGIANSCNGYTTNVTQLVPAGVSNVVANSFAYYSSTLGRYYQSTSSPLINAASRDCGPAGLYHYTVKYTQTKEGAEASQRADIGFHYVACSSGLPIDTDGDGLADYFEDRNGNGTVDSGETDWQQSENGTTGVPGLQVFPPFE
jgi:hypothetical protein